MSIGGPSSCRNEPSGCIGGPSTCKKEPSGCIGMPRSIREAANPFRAQMFGEFTREKPVRYADPGKFIIMRLESVGRFTILHSKYPDCINYEGNKILVYENISARDLVDQRRLDPHFCDHKECVAPIARFEPTQRGWEMAITLCKTLL